MEILTLGNITFVADGSGVSVTLGDRPEYRQALSAREAERLEEFLRHCAPRERRLGFRVRIAPLSGRVRTAFRVQLTVGTGVVDVRPVDLSLTGMLVAAREVALRPGAEVPVTLALHGLECHLTGSVVRLEGDLVALHFLESLKDGELTPPEPLLGMYRTLETEWLRARRSQAGV